MELRAFAKPPWRALATLSGVLLAGLALRCTDHDRVTRCGAVAIQRVAIRVDCGKPADCDLAESIALDVWSEHRGVGLPLDVVVASDELPKLVGVPWQVLVPDI